MDRGSDKGHREPLDVGRFQQAYLKVIGKGLFLAVKHIHFIVIDRYIEKHTIHKTVQSYHILQYKDVFFQQHMSN